MLSSVSYVCFGVCAGMWVISRGIYVWMCSFCLSSWSCCSSVRVIFFYFLFFRVCVCSFCFYFADVFSSTMWSDLRAAVPQGSRVLFRILRCLAEHPVLPPSIFLPTTDGGLGHENDGLTVFPASFCYLSASFND